MFKQCILNLFLFVFSARAGQQDGTTPRLLVVMFMRGALDSEAGMLFSPVG